MTRRSNIKVYKVPFTMTVNGCACVIADSPQTAIGVARAMDLGDFITHEDNAIALQDAYGFFVDFDSVETAGMAAVSTVLIDEDYDPSDHPDYNPSEHDEEGDAEGDPDAQALARSHNEGGAS